jgi:hypothetical protein
LYAARVFFTLKSMPWRNMRIHHLHFESPVSTNFTTLALSGSR